MPHTPPRAGILAGAVSITAPCALVLSYGAAIIGCVGACVYTLASRLLVRCAPPSGTHRVPPHHMQWASAGGGWVGH